VGTVGPGKRLEGLLKDSAEIVLTVYCGDNYFAPHRDEVLASVVKLARDHKVDMLVAGPAFGSGRHGFACAEVCQAVSTSLGVNSITAMYAQNPGVDSYQQYKNQEVFIFPTTEAVSGMEDALAKIVKFIKKLAAGAVPGPAAEEGYIPRGLRFNAPVDKLGAERAVDMLLDKLAGRPFTTELPVEYFEKVPVAPGLSNLKDACLALITTMGVVPPGNPDGFKVYRNTQWKKYFIGNLQSMQDSKWHVVHGGYNSAWMIENANYCVPVDACRQLEKEGVFARLYPYFFSTNGGMGFIGAMKAIGHGIALDMKVEMAHAAILVSA